ncbi:hypothetical protein HKX48_007558 [Thoreauomyces humboldtii]|nr:hypothetical protein HKX48_007558 [Thoreauomyces humboldtii]
MEIAEPTATMNASAPDPAIALAPEMIGSSVERGAAVEVVVEVLHEAVVLERDGALVDVKGTDMCRETDTMWVAVAVCEVQEGVMVDAEEEVRETMDADVELADVEEMTLEDEEAEVAEAVTVDSVVFNMGAVEVDLAKMEVPVDTATD